MADIKVERKGPSVWPWILGLLVAALLIWLLVELFGDREAEAVSDTPVGSIQLPIGEHQTPVRFRAA